MNKVEMNFDNLKRVRILVYQGQRKAYNQTKIYQKQVRILFKYNGAVTTMHAIWSQI